MSARRGWCAVGIAAVLVAGSGGTALADTLDPRPAGKGEVLRPISPPAAGLPKGFGEVGAGAAKGIKDGDGIPTASAVRPVAPGVRLTSFDRWESDKWLRADALSVDLDGSSKVGYLGSGNVAQRKTVSEMAAGHQAGAGRRTVAASNADFFDINETGAPLGPGISEGGLLHSARAGDETAVGIGSASDAEDSAGRILQLYFDGTLKLPGGVERKLDSYNAANVPAAGVGVYTPQWGEANRAQAVDGSARIVEVTVTAADGKVASVADKAGSGEIPAGTTVLLGRDAGAEALAGLKPGDALSMEYRPRTDGGALPRTAVGGRGLLVVDGQAQDWEGKPNNAAAPRTAVGFSKDGLTMHLITVDGRQADSGGTTLTELAVMMKQLGAYNALNLDGGGSSTLVAREPGSDRTQVENSPSDGSERTVPNGLAITAPDGSGKLTGYWVETAMEAGTAPGVDPVRGGHPERVFPGLRRTLTAAGYDETYGPAAGTPRWTVGNPKIGRIGSDGVFRARAGGSTEAVARSGSAGGGSAKGTVKLTVLDELDRIVPTTRRLGLPEASATGRFGVVGLDAHGASASVEVDDVALDYDRAKFEVAADGKGGFTVKAKAGQAGSGRITATVAGHTTALAVTIGLENKSVADFEDASGWTFSAARATGSVAPEPAGHSGAGLKLAYDFSKDSANRAAYANPPAQIPVAGQPQSFTMWIKGDGKGAWPSLHLKDAAGSDQVLRAPYVTWTGWKQVTFAVPAGVAYPLKVHRFYLAEAGGAARQYTGEVVLDELVAQVPPQVDVPSAPVVADPLIATAKRTGGRDWRYAVMSDAQFVVREPDSELVKQARRTFKEIRAARPDFVVINGDLVDEGSPADLAFARQVIEEGLGKAGEDGAVPWHYVPGNHEVMGGKIENFIAEFGPAQQTFDHKGTRFITMDTSALSLRGGGHRQIRELREQLDRAAKDSGVGSVTVIQHVPPRDPTPQAGSRLGDRKEAAVLEGWLSEFRRSSGKGAAMIGSHVGVFDASRVDGVPYLVNGNSGKNPAAPPAAGGFTGWSMVGVDRVSPLDQRRARQRPFLGGPDWVSVQTRAHVDGLTLDAPEKVAPGSTAKFGARVAQAGREVPVGWPLSADWSGSDNLWIGDADGMRGRHIAAYNPGTGEFTALRRGTVRLSVTVNGVTERQEVVIG